MFRTRTSSFAGAAMGLGLAIGSASCFPGDIRDRHASLVETYRPTPFLPPEQLSPDPNRALGPPDGRVCAVGRGAFLVLRFFRMIPDGPGADLRVYEVGADGAEARVAVSNDGVDYVEFESLASGPSSSYDLAAVGLSRASFVRVRGLDDRGIEPGFDLDAVEALH